MKVVQDQRSMVSQLSCDLFHRLDAGPHDISAPAIQELGGTGRQIERPEMLKFLLEKIGPDGAQVHADQILDP